MDGAKTRCVRMATVAMAVLLVAGCEIPGVSRPSRSGAGGPAGAPSGQGGSGIAAKTPTEILAQARTAMRGATSVHVKGSISESGQRVALNLKLTKTTAYGKMKAPVKGSSVLFQLIKTEDKIYVRGRQMWLKTAGPAAARRFGNRWVGVRKDAPGFSQFGKVASLTGMDEILNQSGRLTKDKAATVRGKPAIGLKDSRGDLLYIATTGKPYPLRIAGVKSGQGSIDFYEWDAPVRVSAPRGAVNANL